MNRAAVACIEKPDGQLLCVWNLRYKGWSLPGGKVEDGETPEQAVARELKEETGLILETAELIYAGEHGMKVDSTRGSHVYIFRVTASGEPKAMEKDCPITTLSRVHFLRMSPFAEFYRKVFAAVPGQHAMIIPPTAKFMIWDNGVSYSGHAVRFVRLNDDVVSRELLQKILEPLERCGDACEGGVVAFLEAVEWRDPEAIEDVWDFVEPWMFFYSHKIDEDIWTDEVAKLIPYWTPKYDVKSDKHLNNWDVDVEFQRIKIKLGLPIGENVARYLDTLDSGKTR